MSPVNELLDDMMRGADREKGERVRAVFADAVPMTTATIRRLEASGISQRTINGALNNGVEFYSFALRRFIRPTPKGARVWLPRQKR